MISRYKTQEMNDIFNEKTKFDIFLKIELLVVEAMYLQGVIPEIDLTNLKNNSKFKLERIYDIEKKTHHDVIAFIESVSESLGEEKKWLHYGLTSSDIVDTTYAYRFSLANNILEDAIKEFISVLKEKALLYKRTPCIGRTHGIHAEITSFGLKFANYYDEMKRNLNRFTYARNEIETGKISGAVGSFANIEPYVQEYVCKQLGINSANISTQIISRDIYAFYFSTLTLISSSLEKIATEIRQLQRTEINEVQEYFETSQKGSSAMPHKRNPISSENICGCARVMRGYMLSAYENINLWHERDLSNSSVERIIVEDACHLLHYMLKRYTKTIQTLKVNADKMTQNIYITKGSIFSENIMQALIKNGMYRSHAYDIVKNLVLESMKNQQELKDLCYKKLSSKLDKKEIDDCFSIELTLKNVDSIYKKLEL